MKEFRSGESGLFFLQNIVVEQYTSYLQYERTGAPRYLGSLALTGGWIQQRDAIGRM